MASRVDPQAVFHDKWWWWHVIEGVGATIKGYGKLAKVGTFGWIGHLENDPCLGDKKCEKAKRKIFLFNGVDWWFQQSFEVV